tara:strand:+ start:524 stop:1213 length:690 start_codon:yes stop_codon:yes gene_type:complete
MSRIRANTITNKAATGAPTFSNGAVVTGVCTATTFSGSGASLTSLPAGNLTGTLPAISGANLTGITAGITDFDTWFLTGSFNGSVDPISNNLSRYTSGGANKLGTGMSVSSGVFTFPATGYWRITCKWRGQRQSGHQSQYQKIEIKSTSDNFSSSNILAVADGTYYDNYPTGGRQNSGSASIIFDVTNTSTHKIRFAAVLADNSGNGNEILGSGSIALTSFEFIKLADT